MPTATRDWIKDVLILIATDRQIRSLLIEQKALCSDVQKWPDARRLPLRAVMVLAWLIAWTALTHHHAEAQIYRLPDYNDDDGLQFEERAADFREHIPQQLQDNPLQPSEARIPLIAQLPDRPAWAPPANATGPAPQPGERQIRVRGRGTEGLSARSVIRGDQRVWIVSVPTQVTIFDESGVVEISADRIVAWAGSNVVDLDNSLGGSTTPVELYMEGNIEFRQGHIRLIAERLYYNVGQQIGVGLEVELLTGVRRGYESSTDEFQTPFRIKADVLRQLSPNLFQANNAAGTTSRLGVPQYWIESGTLTLDTGMTRLVDQLSQSGITPDSTFGRLSQFDRLQVTSEDSQLFIGGWPVFRWPSFTTDLARNPSLYLDRFRVGSDGVFGQQLLTSWNNFQLLGITPDQDTDWTTTLDYLSDRGLGFGTDFEYRRDEFFGQPALATGSLNSWFINDNGRDNLGQDRRDVPLEQDFRGRVYGFHRHATPSGFEFMAELGWISDRNFLEQYFEEEWDLGKDQETRLELKRYTGNGVWSVGGNFRLNDFFTQTEWLPRGEHYEIGRSLFSNRLTWYEHSQIGYARLRTADAPTNPIDARKFDPLAWERESEGIRAVTRQEIDMPIQLGGAKVVPYVLGEVAHWQEDLTGGDTTRLLGQAGVRTSVPWWRVDPTVQNELFNLNGLAHKFVLDTEFLWADASQDYLQLPLYDALDDDSVEFFRRRFLFDTFLGSFGDDVPLKYDERTFAFRSGMQRSVAAPSTEIADDLMMFQVRLRQELETKRGPPGRQRTVDVFTFDVESTFFPRPHRDNFGQEIGPTTYDMRWHVGDRTTLLSDAYLDFFGDGLRTVSLGAALSRPGRSQYYFGIRSIEGPVSSNVLTSTVSYRLSPKWKIDYGSSLDLSGTGNIGQSARFVRIGESVFVALGAYYDASRNNFGIRFDIAPRFIRSKLGMIGGRPIPPVGAFGLE